MRKKDCIDTRVHAFFATLLELGVRPKLHAEGRVTAAHDAGLEHARHALCVVKIHISSALARQQCPSLVQNEISS